MSPRLPGWLVAAAVAFLLGTWLLGAPPPERAVESVARAYITVLGRGDVRAAYRLTDLDFRAVCPEGRFAASMRARAERYRAVRVVSVRATPPRGLRASAIVVLSGPEGERVEQWEFAREGSRWYVYEDAARCASH